jgi:hypothetical protein
MPSASEHQIKANHNRAFLNSITDPAFCDWKAVAAFYTAVHLVEQLFALQGLHSQDHRSRNRQVRVRFRPIHKHYRPLYNLSMVARYRESSKFRLTASAVESLTIGTHLVAIGNYVTAQVSGAISTPPPPPTAGT